MTLIPTREELLAMAKQPVTRPGGTQRLGQRREPGIRTRVCPECQGAGMHRTFCSKFRTTNTTRDMAVHFGVGRLGSAGLAGRRLR